MTKWQSNASTLQLCNFAARQLFIKQFTDTAPFVRAQNNLAQQFGHCQDCHIGQHFPWGMGSVSVVTSSLIGKLRNRSVAGSDKIG